MLTLKDHSTIDAIADRAAKLYDRLGIPVARRVLADEVTATHSEIVPLKLTELLEADESNFAHDIGGIHRHLSRMGGKWILRDCFMPRFHAL